MYMYVHTYVSSLHDCKFNPCLQNHFGELVTFTVQVHLSNLICVHFHTSFIFYPLVVYSQKTRHNQLRYLISVLCPANVTRKA